MPCCVGWWFPPGPRLNHNFGKWTTIFEKRNTPRKKVSLAPKKSENEAKKKVFLPNHQGMDILQKTRSDLVYFGRWSFVSDLPPPYRGLPPCAIFPIPVTKKYSTAMCYSFTLFWPLSVRKKTLFWGVPGVTHCHSLVRICPRDHFPCRKKKNLLGAPYFAMPCKIFLF